MIRHIAHAGIDKRAWDRMLLDCTNRIWYAQSWVLDIASPGWEALVDAERGALMPLTHRRRYGIDYLFQPYALQQLGPFAPQVDQALCDEFVAAVPRRFAYWDIWLNEAVRITPGRGIRLVEHADQALMLDVDAEALRGGYSQGHRRNLRRPVPGSIVFGPDASAAEFVELFIRTTGARFGGIPKRDAMMLEQLIGKGIERGECSVPCVRSSGAVIAAICFAQWEGRSILLKSASDELGQTHRAAFRLIDRHIARLAGTGLLLDFAGSNNPSAARFNAGFGAASRVYLRLVRNRLPPPLRWFKR